MAGDELVIEKLVAGGDGLARGADGRVVFVTGAAPGERVRVELVAQKKDFARARVVEVLDPSPDRVGPPCRFVAAGCGGCDWQHLALDAQREAKRAFVAETVRRLAHVNLEVTPGPVLPATGFRTTVRATVEGDRLALRRARSHDPVAVDHCLVAHPLVDEVLATARVDSRDDVTIRAAPSTGERMIVLERGQVRGVPADVSVAVGKRPKVAITEHVRGATLRISARSFFQSRLDGAEALVDAVAAVVGHGGDDAHLVDLYGGVGLFGATVGQGRRVTVVESSASSARDAAHNLPRATVLRTRVERWQPVAADLVVADPPRTGLGRAGVDAVVATAAPTVALISCDSGSFGRDVSLLAEQGYRPGACTLIDLFPHTSHVEIVTAFIRGAGRLRRGPDT